MSDLQQFVIKFFNTLGAAVEEIDYALIDVLIDDELENIFGKSELKLCFDYEVYLENQEYELVTFGSFILDKIIELSFKFSNTCIRYAVVDNVNVSDTEKKIKNFLSLDRTNIEITDESKFINYFTKYNFKVSYISDNTVEEFKDIVVDMNSLCVSDLFYENLNRVFYEKTKQYDYPLNCSVDFLSGLKEALKKLDDFKKVKIDKLNNTMFVNKECERINLYYDSLKVEAEKRMKRKNLSEEKINEYKHKIEIYNVENQRQLKEIKEKYKVKTQVFLENAVVYAVPMILFKYKLIGRNNNDEEFRCVYNTVFKEFQKV